jgi:hypothetical protein
MYNGVAVLGKTLAVSQKVKQSTKQPRNSIPSYIPKNNEPIYTHQNLHTDIHSHQMALSSNPSTTKKGGVNFMVYEMHLNKKEFNFQPKVEEN